MPQWLTFRRTSGRDPAAVRHPTKAQIAAKITPPTPVLADLRKDQLVELAEKRGVETEGTKAELVERLSDG